MKTQQLYRQHEKAISPASIPAREEKNNTFLYVYNSWSPGVWCPCDCDCHGGTTIGWDRSVKAWLLDCPMAEAKDNHQLHSTEHLKKKQCKNPSYINPFWCSLCMTSVPQSCNLWNEVSAGDIKTVHEAKDRDQLNHLEQNLRHPHSPSTYSGSGLPNCPNFSCCTTLEITGGSRLVRTNNTKWRFFNLGEFRFKHAE